MKKLLLLISICALGAFSTSYAQNSDYYSEVRGDTLVVKNLIDMEGEINSLVDLIESDTQAPDTRVYELKRGTMQDGQAIPSLYLTDRQFTTPERPIQIVGEDAGPIVGGELEDGRPPLIAHAGTQEGTAIFTFQDDFTLKNLAAMGGSNQGLEGWWPFGAAAGSDSSTVVFDNVLMEHNNWVYVHSNDASYLSLHIRDSYFLNMTGQPTRRNGGVYDSENFRLKELVVENSTHLQAAGMMYKFRNHTPERVFVNHNTFVNSTGQLFTTRGYEINMTVTNNLFVNSNIQAYYPGLDDNETDLNHLPHGIINLNYLEGTDWEGEPHGVNPDLLPEGFEPEDRKVLVAKNGVYWDPRLDEIINFLNENDIPCDDANCQDIDGEWISQMITMNSRTQEMFDNDEDYPLLTEGDWYMEGDPGFTDMPDLVQELIDWGIATGPAGNTELMTKFRSEGNDAETGEAENFINFDWPLAADLSYSNSAYLDGALGEYPVGDLNWFPAEKSAWLAEKDALYAELDAALNEGRLPTSNEEGTSYIPSSIKLEQNYPNPFNPTTNVRYELSRPANVEITVYDALGKKVATLVNGQYHQVGSYTVKFDAGNLSSGIYFYELRAGDIVQTKKMMLIK